MRLTENQLRRIIKNLLSEMYYSGPTKEAVNDKELKEIAMLLGVDAQPYRSAVDTIGGHLIDLPLATVRALYNNRGTKDFMVRINNGRNLWFSFNSVEDVVDYIESNS